MAWKLAEQLVNEAIAYLDANDDAKVTALNTEYGDSLLEKPVIWSNSEKALKSVANWPVGVVLVEDSNYHWQGPSITAGHTLIVGILMKDQDTDKLRKKGYRYARMIVELLAESNGFTSKYQLGAGETEIIFSPLFEEEDSDFTADVHVSMNVSLEEIKA